jgi:hypothetical protein
MHWQAVLPIFGPLLFGIVEQLTQILLITAFVAVLQVQVPLIRLSGEGQ